jgi:hypothetical protein
LSSKKAETLDSGRGIVKTPPTIFVSISDSEDFSQKDILKLSPLGTNPFGVI